jgi:hypothetical protein
VPTYTNVDSHYSIPALKTLEGYWLSWENQPGGPNHGPLLVTADPEPHQPAEIKLTTFDIKKCRRANGPVFYEYSVRNNSSTDAFFSVEVVWGNHEEAASHKDPEPW